MQEKIGELSDMNEMNEDQEKMNKYLKIEFLCYSFL